ncbi:helix-turn-helix transcriptional regulator [Geobacter argillaceus]|uniref:AlpA family transcriptional regulator n=1 Tax=Geobacter argillaceus TaxID=345631 RepID=A0A562WTT4_9BACT|nr:AlpA family transcriptional regulator [Geobacter argillaceus]
MAYKSKPTVEDRNVSLGECISILGRSRSSILRDVEAGRIPRPFKLGGKVYWRLSELRECMEQMRHAA